MKNHGNEKTNLYDKSLEGSGLFNEIFLGSPYILLLLDENGDILALNKKAYDFFETDNATLIKQNWVKNFTEDDFKKEVESLIKDMFYSKKKFGFAENYLEYSVIAKNGLKKCSWNKTIIENKVTKAYFLLLSGEDISLKHLLEKGFLESELRFRSLFESTSETVFNVNLDWTFKDLNRAGREFFKIVDNSSSNSKLTDFFVDANDKQFFVKILKKHKFIKDYEVHLTDCDGNSLYAIINCNIVEENDEAVGFQGIIRDYTERYKKEEKLRLLQKAVDCSTGIVMITDVNGRIEHVNPVFEKITGYSESEVIGKNARILSSGENDFIFFKNFWMALNKGLPWNGEFINKKKNGDLFNLKCNVSPVFSKDGMIKHFMSVGVDTTKEKALEKQVSQAAKMETVGRLAGGIAHDFNNLLTIINGYADMLIDFSEDEAIKEDLMEIKNAGEKAAALTRQILAFSRKNKSKPELIDVNKAISDFQKMLVRLTGENIDFIFNFYKEPVFIKIDPSQLEQIILNLVVNARDAMRKGGSLSLGIDLEYLDGSKQITEKNFVSGDYVIIKIKDSGVGIPKEIIDKIFEPFFTTKKEGEGTGLGLSTVYGIVKQNNGLIKIESEVGLGTTILIYLLKIDGEKISNETKLINCKSQFIGKRVLIVEDDKQVREIAEIIFRELSFTVFVAKDSEEALAFAEKWENKVDLIFCDLILPKMTGQELCENIQKKYGKINCLYTSGYPEEHLAKTGIKIGDIQLIHKPYSKEDIFLKLVELGKNNSNWEE